MPWPATHILIAEKVFDRCFNHLNRKAFILGTCFPDIRYPAKIDRNKTHIKNIPLSTIQTQSAFRAGLLFHSYVDNLWNGFIRSYSEEVFSVVPHNRPMFHTMKILQDQLLYARFKEWPRVVTYFETILPEEKTFGAQETIIQCWHDMLSHYLSKPTNENDLEMLSLSLPPELVQTIRTYYQNYQSQPLLSQILTEFYFQVNDLINPQEDLT
jgi:hypothetical protein